MFSPNKDNNLNMGLYVWNRDNYPSMIEVPNITTRSKSKSKKESTYQNEKTKHPKEGGDVENDADQIDHHNDKSAQTFQNTEIGKVFKKESELSKFQNEIITQAKAIDDYLAFTTVYNPIHSIACRDVYFYEMGRNHKMPTLWTQFHQNREQIQKEYLDFLEYQRLKQRFSNQAEASHRHEGLHYFKKYADSNYDKRIYTLIGEEEEDEEEDEQEESGKKKITRKKPNPKRKKGKESLSTPSKKQKL
jgi:hypothetical protein